MPVMSPIVLLVVGAVLLNLYALVLVLARGPLFGTRVYRPMVLNIALSLAPAVVLTVVALAILAVTVAAPSVIVTSLVIWLVFGLGGLAWLLVLPNSAYLITELNLSHRSEHESVPLWYDIVLVLTLALSGVVNALLNVLLVQIVYALLVHTNDTRPLARPDSWVLAGVILLLVSLGMYLGRYLRLNSWDVTHPASFARKLRRHFATPGAVREAVGFCLAHTVLLAIVYTIVVAPAVGLLQPG